MSDLTLITYGDHFLINVEDGAKNYKRDHPLPLVWRSFTVVLVKRKGLITLSGHYSSHFVIL